MYTKSQRMVILFSGWILVVLALLAVLGTLDAVSVEDGGIYGTFNDILIYNYQAYFFILCFVGFLVIAETTGPFLTRPRWKSRVNLLVIAGLIVFGVIVFIKVWDIIAPRLLP